MSIDRYRDYTLTELLRVARLSRSAASEMLGRSARTLYKWDKNPPPWVYRSLLLQAGYLGAISQHWDGWRLYRDKLWTPEDWSVGPGEVRCIPIRESLVKELDAQLSNFQSPKENLDDPQGNIVFFGDFK